MPCTYNKTLCSHLWWALAQYHVNHVVLNDWTFLGLFDQIIETAEEGSVGRDVVKDTCHGLLFALNHNMFDS